MAKTQLTLRVPEHLAEFYDRKVAEITKAVPGKHKAKVSRSSVFEGLLSAWKALEDEEAERRHKRNARKSIKERGPPG